MVREMLSVRRDEIAPYALSFFLACGHIEIETEERTDEWERERSLAVQAEGKPFKEALRFSRGLGTALRKCLTLPETCLVVSWDIYLDIHFESSGNVISGRVVLATDRQIQITKADNEWARNRGQVWGWVALLQTIGRYWPFRPGLGLWPGAHGSFWRKKKRTDDLVVSSASSQKK